MRTIYLRFCLAMLLFFSLGEAGAQRYLADYDTMMFFKDTLRPLLKRLENLHFSGYIQPQFQVAQEEGAETFAGGNFQQFSDNRFMIRRARIKLDYVVPAKNDLTPKAIFTFQFEATERDVNVRDMFVRVFEPKKNFFSLSMGLFSRPFGYEVNLSSGFRETPERGRASQSLMPSERDLGAMISYEPIKKKTKLPAFKFDVGIFNGQGKSGPAEFDSFKDLISRIYIRPASIARGVELSGGLSILNGGWRQATKYRYEMGMEQGNKVFVVDSSLGNIGKKAPRRYYGADAQLVFRHDWGKTEIRSEYWRGTQPGTASSTFNPGTLPLTPTYIRNFDAAFFYFLQNIVNPYWELMAKYDFYDPNRHVSGTELGKSGTNLEKGDLRYHTFGFGLTRYFRDNLKFLVYYDIVRNEITEMPGFTSDVRDNVFTFRIQLRF
jgi:hypothetical protein